MTTKQVIENIRRKAADTLPAGATLLLYGSRARGDAHSSSDWDLLIILDKPAYPLRVLGWDIGEEINPQVYAKGEWQSYSFSPFYKNVEKDKIVLL
mgnify:CR=1 FL=1